MNPIWKDFFNDEKKRFFTPDPYFHARVLSRLRNTSVREIEIWDVVPASTRPVFGLALMLLLTFLAVQTFLPQVPERGFLDAVLESESEPEQAFLYTGEELPADQELLNHLMGFEDR